VDLFDVTEGMEKKQTFEFKLGKVGPVASRQEQSHPHQAIFGELIFSITEVNAELL